MDKANLLILLGTLGIRYDIFEHAPVMTVEESSRFHKNIPGMPCKCLFLKSKDTRYWLVAVLSKMRVNLKSLQRESQCSRLSFAGGDSLMELLGVTPGAVTLFAVVNDIAGAVGVAMEKSLAETELFCFHPLVNTATIALSPDDMRKVFAHTGHDPIVVHEIGL